MSLGTSSISRVLDSQRVRLRKLSVPPHFSNLVLQFAVLCLFLSAARQSPSTAPAPIQTLLVLEDLCVCPATAFSLPWPPASILAISSFRQERLSVSAFVTTSQVSCHASSEHGACSASFQACLRGRLSLPLPGTQRTPVSLIPCYGGSERGRHLSGTSISMATGRCSHPFFSCGTVCSLLPAIASVRQEQTKPRAVL